MTGATRPAPRVPGFEIGDRIGSGGFSTVYAAYDPKLDRDVAIKLLNLAVSDPVAQRRFLRECRLMGRLGSHPHVLTVFAADVLDDDRPYIVMELLSGGTLADRAPLPQDEVLRIGVLVGSALADVHAAGVVHRDVKPHNVLLSAFGQPVLGDFGVSGVIDQGGAVSNPMALSPLYAAPEAFHGLPDATSDQYSLAATLYSLLAGRSPVEAPEHEALARVMVRVLEEEPEALDPAVADPRLWAVIARGLAKDPADRHASVAALVAALQGVQHHLRLPVTAAVGAIAAARDRPPLAEEARVPTQPPLGGDPPSPPRQAPEVVDTHSTRPAAWPPAPGAGDGPVGGAPSPTPVPPPVTGTNRVTGFPPAPPGAPSSAPMGDRTTSGADPPALDLPPEAAPAPDRPGRRGGSLMPVVALVVVGIVLALVVIVVLGTGGGDDADAATTTTEGGSRSPFPTEVTLAPPGGPDHTVVWTSVAPDATYVVSTYTDIDPGLPSDVRSIRATQLAVVTEPGVGTCFEVRVAGSPDAPPQIDPDACTPGTTPDAVLDR